MQSVVIVVVIINLLFYQYLGAVSTVDPVVNLPRSQARALLDWLRPGLSNLSAIPHLSPLSCYSPTSPFTISYSTVFSGMLAIYTRMSPQAGYSHPP